MAKTEKNPGEVLQSFIEKYRINSTILSRDIKLNYKTVLDILKGQARITIPTALKLGKYFGTTPNYWIDVQTQSEIDKISTDKKFQSVLRTIPKVVTPLAAAKIAPAKTKSKTSSARKNAARIAYAKSIKGKRSFRGKRK
jgi:addiction module HigA family antidote